MSINPLGVDLLSENDEGEEVCVICQDTLTNAPTYALPECMHRYHTHCIVTWFRHRPSSQDHDTGPDGRCPICGNQGINSGGPGAHSGRDLRRWRRYGSNGAEKMRYNVVMKEARKPGAPRELTKIVQKFNLSKKALEETETEFRLFKKNVREEPVNYRETQKKLIKLRQDVWRKKMVTDGCRRAITHFPIIPIIIPTPIDIN